MRTVAVLFAREDSIYKTIEGCDVWDKERDAMKWAGGAPAICHPPCRKWGEMSHLSTAPKEEKELALWSVNQVRLHGGILEHPARSKLWPAASLPEPGDYDAWGGWTYSAPQYWWGHRAQKNTRFYIVGITPFQLPEVPFAIGDAPMIVSTPGRRADGQRCVAYREIPKSEREHTPIALAHWLVETARLCRR